MATIDNGQNARHSTNVSDYRSEQGRMKRCRAQQPQRMVSIQVVVCMQQIARCVCQLEQLAADSRCTCIIQTVAVQCAFASANATW